jgi:BirA family transcriptional regulator, biotin operon repressor / biotin---[acetyl-CoA-carboxylase] ligase
MSGLYYYHHTASTNKIAYSLALQGEEEGTAVIAESQGAGRGRLGKVWQSPPGKGLYCSLIVRPRLAVEDYPKITLVAGLAVATVLERVSGEEMLLKWPNDVYAAGKKCCGILTESSSLTEEEKNRFAIVGIGINVNSSLSDFPEDLRNKVTSLRILTTMEYDILDIFTQVKKTFLDKLGQLQQSGFIEILEEWRKRDMLVGKWTQWLTNSGKIVFGLCEGPDDSGRLLVKDDRGKVHQVLSGDISLADRMMGKNPESI